MNDPKKTRKKQLLFAVGGAAAIIALLVFGMWANDPNKNKPTPFEVAEQRRQQFTQNFAGKPSEAASPQEIWVATSERQLEMLRKENQQLLKRLERLEDRKNREEAKSSKGNDPTLPPPPSAGNELAIPFLGTPVDLPPPPPPVATQPAATPAPGLNGQDIAKAIVPPMPDARAQGKRETSIQVISLSSGEKDKDKRHNITHYLPTGSFARAVLLSGMDAPTGGQATKDPVPSVLRLKDPGQLPNYFKSDIEDCRITVAGYGDIASERVYMRTEKISCVLRGGRVVEEKVSGWVTGEDGKAGVRGRLVEKRGALLAKTFVSGTLSGLASAFASKYQQMSTSALGTISSIDPDKAGQHGLATGAENALDKLAQYYMDRANEMFPVLEVDANRIVEVVFSDGTDFKEDIIGNMGKGN